MRAAVWGIVGLAAVSIFFRAVPVRALTINPARLTVSVAPGSSQVVAVSIRNDAPSERRYTLGILGVTQDASGRPQFGVGKSLAENWITPDHPTTTIGAGKIKIVYFTVTVPASAPRGVAQYVGLSVSEEATNTAGAVGLSGTLVSLLEIQAAGTVNERADWRVWQSGHLITGERAWPTHFSLFNSGDAAIPLLAKVSIQNIFGKNISQFPATLGSALLPGTARDLIVPVTVGKTLAPGLYFLKMKLTYGYTRQTLERTAVIIYLPKSAQLLLIILGVGGMAVWLARKKHHGINPEK